MSSLTAAKRDLAAAKRAIDEMKVAATLDDIEAAWRAFLHSASKVWIKLELACKSHPKAQPWLGEHLRVRKKDMLLRYLHHARNSDEHTLTEIVSKQGGGIGIRAAPGMSGVYIRSMTINSGPEGTRINYDGSPIEIVHISPRVQLERVLDRGDWYNPPTQHLDQALTKGDPLSVADLGYQYISSMVREAEAKFFSSVA